MQGGKGFTLVEMLVTLGIVALIAAASMPAFWNFLNKYQLDANGRDLVHTLRQAQRLSMESEGGYAYSVHLITGAGGSYTLYRGSSYASRDTEYDDVHALPATLSLSYTVPDADVTFTKIEGSTSDTGTILITWDDGGESKGVSVNTVGRIDAF